MTRESISCRKPQKEDGAAVWRLVKETGTLDLNSVYCYILLCDYFKETCVIAEADGEIAGFVSAFRPPEHPDRLFVWQIAVSPGKQRRGIGRMLLQELLSRVEPDTIRHIEATISPSNAASRALFLSLAKREKLECHWSAGYRTSLFPAEQAHEEELLYKLGPLSDQSAVR
ncbi:L-2,4-diaminobutyric acid acetyltransferase [Paenibacillus sp. UNCCL117]|uniref:diaminobutyrate acetyltransferase n=1 Tax=unclassified Paenibacillus TaxID=185978 RepID=UPI00088E9760|nr:MULTISPECIES: diaminobutyrate acetyltransferase [unclassified Paenibacillus]SDE15272.1 diaminobutyrate acetyltransferase [Paenibacillus sp. cl123]SFW60844.1 L-2,4-diaminobutyric acid acetyltransferase [Paenibacillus sp. UNCCL117]